MNLARESPVPLYQQIAHALRYAIATGRVSAGSRLPSARDAAAKWRVNFHTVRRAYQELERLGLARRGGSHGSFVVRDTPRDARKLGAFLARVETEARKRFRLTPAELGTCFQSSPGNTVRLVPSPVHVMECNEPQAQELADQLARHFRIEAIPWCLRWDGNPPEGPIVGTYFHVQDILERWPARQAQIHFLPIRPDPLMIEELRRSWGGAIPRELRLFEREASMAQAIASDVSAVLAPLHFDVRPSLVRGDGSIPPRMLKEGGLVAPRVWASLPQTQRRAARVLRVRYQFGWTELCALARVRGWMPRTGPEMDATNRTCIHSAS